MHHPKSSAFVVAGGGGRPMPRPAAGAASAVGPPAVEPEAPNLGVKAEPLASRFGAGSGPVSWSDPRYTAGVGSVGAWARDRQDVVDHGHVPLRRRQQRQSGPVDNDGDRDLDMDPDSDDAVDGAQSDEADVDGDGDEGEALPNRKRKRPMSMSCETCKHRKVKCDRGQPSCGWCSRHLQLCEYKERRKPGLRAGYGRELEARLDRLEDVIQSHSEILRTPWNHPNPPTSPQQQQQQQQQQAGNGGGSNGRIHGGGRVPFGAGAAGGSPSTQGVPIHHHQIHHQIRHDTSGMATYHLPPLRQGPPPPSLQPPQDAVVLPVCQPQPATVSDSSGDGLPPYDLLYSLVNLYFEHVYWWCPILHKQDTIGSLFMKNGPPLGEADNILLHSLVALTLRYSDDPRLTEERRRHFHQVSTDKVTLYGMRNSSFKALQALVILALDVIGSSNGPPAWHLMGLITRAVSQLGMTVEHSPLQNVPMGIYTLRATFLPEPRNFVEEETRRRLFWMIYLLDRYSTVATAFDFALDDRQIARTLPCRDDLWVTNQKAETRQFRGHEQHQHQHQHQHGAGGQRTEGPPPGAEGDPNGPDDNLGPFSYYVELLGILSKIHNFLKRPFNISVQSDVDRWKARYRQLEGMLTRWQGSLPTDHEESGKLLDSLERGDRGADKAPYVGWLMLHATIHTTVIRLYSSAGYPTTRSRFFQPSLLATKRCIAAVDRIFRIAEFVVENDLMSRIGPPFVFTVWVAARLLLVHGSTVDRKLSPQVEFFVGVLRQADRYWPVARRYHELLQHVLDEYRASGAEQGLDVVADSVAILADMRRTAYDLDYLISSQPRQPAFDRGSDDSSVSDRADNGTPGNNNHGHVLGVPMETEGRGGSVGRFPPPPPPPPPPATAAATAAAMAASRTPAPHELAYLDVFNFFNYPRMVGGPDAVAGFEAGGGVNSEGMGFGMGAGMGVPGGAGGAGQGMQQMHPGNQFNITNFSLDVNSDWLFKQ